jgi:hypothetical protein
MLKLPIILPPPQQSPQVAAEAVAQPQGAVAQSAKAMLVALAMTLRPTRPAAAAALAVQVLMVFNLQIQTLVR